MRLVILLGCLGLALLLAAYFIASALFCAGVVNGDFGGCAAMTGADMRNSVAAQSAALTAGAGAVYLMTGRLMTGRRRKKG